MPTMFYSVLMTAVFIGLWIAFQNIAVAVVIIDFFVIMFPDKFPLFVQQILGLVNVFLWASILIGAFAPRKAS